MPQPESNSALVAVAVLCSLFAVATVVLGSALGVVLVVYVHNKRVCYGTGSNGKDVVTE